MLHNKIIKAKYINEFGIYYVWGFVTFNSEYISLLDFEFLVDNKRVGYSEYSIIDGIKVLESSQDEHKDAIYDITIQIQEYLNNNLKELFNTL